jgi:hypothetical protein
MAHYCRIYLKGKKSFLLRVDYEGARFINGIEVDIHGDEIVPAGHDERRHVIEKTAIHRRACQDWHQKYGKLVPALKQFTHHPLTKGA